MVEMTMRIAVLWGSTIWSVLRGLPQLRRWVRATCYYADHCNWRIPKTVVILAFCVVRIDSEYTNLLILQRVDARQQRALENDGICRFCGFV